MGDKFIITPKSGKKEEGKTVVISLRIDKNLQNEYNRLAEKSDRSRNELMCMALQYALDNLEITSD